MTARACAVTLAGLDPSGGAGILADARAFVRAGAWPCAVAAVLTVQSTAGLRAVMPVPAADVVAQAEAVFAHQRVRAVKTGALGSSENVRAVASLAATHATLPWVVDPVMIATRAEGGARLLDDEALAAMHALVARATVVTPNRDEAEALLERAVRDEGDLADAARALVALGARAALVKGGHLDGSDCVDVLALRGGETVMLRGARAPGPEFHGGGCTLAALIAGRLAVTAGEGSGALTDAAIVDAARWARSVLASAIEARLDVGDGLRVLPLDA